MRIPAINVGTRVALDLAAGKVTVSYAAGLASREHLRGAVRGAGYEVGEQVSAAQRAGGCCGGCG